MPREHVDDLVAGRRPAREEVGRGDEDPRRAETTLQRMMAAEGLLQRAEVLVSGQRLDGRDRAPVGLDGEQAAAAHRDAVEEHGARAADPVLAADVRPREPEPVAEEVREQEPRLDRLPHGRAVHGERDLDHRAASIARVTSVPVRERR